MICREHLPEFRNSPVKERKIQMLWHKYILQYPQWGIADTEIKVPSVENTELTSVLPLKLGVGQNIATHASPAPGDFFDVLTSTFKVHSPSFFSLQIFSPTI